MIRKRNWDNELIRTAHSLSGSDLVWGESDCASVAIKCLNSMYEDYMLPETPYDSLRGATKFFATGGMDKYLEDASASIIGVEYATCGDIVVDGLDDEGLPSICVLLRRAMITSNGDKGVVLTERDLGDAIVYRLPR